MDSLSSSSDLAAGKGTSLTAGILSSLSSLFSGNTAGPEAFAALLAGDPSLPATTPTPPPAVPSSTPNVAASNDGSGDSKDNASSTPSALAAVVKELHRIVDHITHRDKKSGASDADTNTNTNANANTDGAKAFATPNPTQLPTSSPASTSTTGTNSSVNSAGTGVVDSADASSAAGTTGTMSDIVAILTDLMKLMEQKLQTAQTTASGFTGATTQTPDSGNGNTSAADPLTQLLALLQTLQQQLTTTASGTAASSLAVTTASGNAAPDGAAAVGQPSPAENALQDLVQLQKDLKNLMALLQNAGAVGDAGMQTAASNGSSGTTPAVAPAAAANASSPTDTGTTDKPSLASQDSLFDMLGGIFGNIFSNAPPPSNYTALANANVPVAEANMPANTPDTTSQNDNSLSGDGGSPNLAGLSANLTALSATADGTKAADPYAFANQLSALRAANGGVAGLPDAVEQVILQINRGAKNGDDQMSIQLHPAELGKINVKLDISSDGQVRGTVVADNPSTLNMLHKDVRSLERALQEAGLRADPGSLQFSLGGQSGNPGQTANNFASSGKASTGASSPGTASNTALDIPATADEIYYLTPGRVNMKV